MTENDKDIDQIIKGELDLYGFLEVGADASDSQIRTQYRRKALMYHPDKEGGDADKFNLLSKVYEILIDEGLRSQYNELVRIRKQRKVEAESLLASTKKFQEQLHRAEQQHLFNTDRTGEMGAYVSKRKWASDLEKLKEDGLKRRRVHEKAMYVPPSAPVQPYVSYRELPPPKIYIASLHSADSPAGPAKGMALVQVKWKHKRELVQLFTSDVLKQIMEIFGPIDTVQISPNPNHNRYDTATVRYTTSAAALSAANYNYKTAAKWDGTTVRKLASLLRECTLIDKHAASNSVVGEVLSRFCANRI